MGMNSCPSCQSETLVKAGKNASGSQRYQCKHCKGYVTPAPKPKGHAPSLQTMALKLYLEGNGLRRIGRLLGVAHQTVTNWINRTHAHLTPAPQPVQSAVIELDELFTFVQSKKTKFTLSQRWIAPRVVSSVGWFYSSEPGKNCKRWWIRDQKHPVISVMDYLYMPMSIITADNIRRCWTNHKPIPSKGTMPN